MVWHRREPTTVLDKFGHGCGRSTESQHIDICKLINLPNLKVGRQKSATSHTKEAKLAWKLESETLLDNCKTMKKKKKHFKTKRDANETASLVPRTVTLNVWYKLESWQSIGKFGLRIASQVAAQWLTYPAGIRTNKSTKKPPNIKTRETRGNANQVTAQWLTYPTGIYNRTS